MRRREFLESAAVLTTGTLFAQTFAWASAQNTIDDIGLQLFTLRDLLKVDFEGTIAKVAAIGYKEVEFAGYFDKSPKDVRALLKKNGLKSPACHVQFNALSSELWPKQIEAAKEIGHSYIVNPWIPEELRKTVDHYKHVADTFNRAGEQSKKAKIQFAYHNHWFEFQPIDGKLPYEILLEHCDPKLVAMEMDLAWISVAGVDPVKYFDRYPGRFPLVHLKGIKTLPKPSSLLNPARDEMSANLTDVGSGIIDWKRILAKSEKAGIKHYFVENDAPKDALTSIQNSYKYLRKLKF